MEHSREQYTGITNTMDYTFAMILYGLCVIAYMLSINSVLWGLGFSISPLLETSHNAILYFIISPFFIIVAYRTNVTENTSYLLLYLCLIFLPIMFISFAIYYYFMGSSFVYFENQTASLSIVDTFAVKVFKALPVVVFAPFVWIFLSRWSARKRQLVMHRLVFLNKSLFHTKTSISDQNILTKEQDAKFPEQVRNLLAKRWREMLWQRTAVYGTLPFIFLLLLHTGFQKFDQYILWAIVISVFIAAIYYFIVVITERALPDRGLSDNYIIMLEALPLLSWTALLLALILILMNNTNDLIFSNQHSLPLQNTSIFMLLVANWGLAITITAGISSTRFVAAYLPRLVCLIVFAFIIYIFVPDPAWSVAVLTAIFFTALATIISYFSYIHNLQQIAANLERDDAVNQAKQEYQNRQNLVNRIGHDLKNIHYSIHLLAGRLETRYENLSEEIGIVREGIQYAKDLFADIQNAHFIGNQTPAREPVNLGELLGFVVKTFQEQAKINNIQIKFCSTSLSLNTDISMMERIVRNILSNAIKHSQCTKILLGIKRRSYEDRHYCELWIIDNGNGINFLNDKEKTEKVSFDSNDTDNLRSLRLGLRIIEELCETLGYKYRTVQKKGENTTFIISFPSQDLL